MTEGVLGPGFAKPSENRTSTFGASSRNPCIGATDGAMSVYWQKQLGDDKNEKSVRIRGEIPVKAVVYKGIRFAVVEVDDPKIEHPRDAIKCR